MKISSLRMFFIFTVSALISGCATVTPTSQIEQRNLQKLEKGALALNECQRSSCSELTLSFASLQDYSVLNEMTYVTSLILRYNTFENLEDIADMQQLTQLRIVATKIREVSLFADFENLTVLHIQSALAEDVRPTLLQMPDLKDIAINLPSDGDISFVRSLPNLENMFLLGGGGSISDLSSLRGHRNLRSLTLHLGLPEDLSSLLEIPNLQSLTVLDSVEREDSSGVIEQLKENGIMVNLIGPVI